jgi:hypothetical protein
VYDATNVVPYSTGLGGTAISKLAMAGGLVAHEIASNDKLYNNLPASQKTIVGAEALETMLGATAGMPYGFYVGTGAKLLQPAFRAFVDDKEFRRDTKAVQNKEKAEKKRKKK